MSAPDATAGTLTVSIVTHRSDLALLGRTLHSLAGAVGEIRDLPVEARVTVVDNASGAEYRRQLVQLLDKLPRAGGFSVALLEAPENRGYGAGHNLAIARDCGHWHLVLNPDVEVAPRTLALGVAYLQSHPQAALLSPRASGGSGRQEFLCKRYPSLLVLALRAFAPALGERFFAARLAAYEMRELRGATEPVTVTLASGCFMLFRAQALAAAGGFDEGYFLYFEDFDLSLRCAREGRVLYHPELQIVHHGGYASRKGAGHRRLFVRSMLRFFHQHGWRWI